MKTVADWDTLPQAGKGYSVHSWGLHELPAVAGTRRQLQQTRVQSLWWESLPVLVEAGAGTWGGAAGPLLPCLSTMMPRFLGRPYFR